MLIQFYSEDNDYSAWYWALEDVMILRCISDVQTACVSYNWNGVTYNKSGTYSTIVNSSNNCDSLVSLNLTIEHLNSAGSATSSPTLDVNTNLNPIYHTTTGATGIGTANNLPPGVTASWSSNLITISGTPTTIGTFNYDIPLTGGCGNVSANGTIIVNSVPKTYVPDDNFEAYLETHDANGNVVSVGDANSMGDGIANNDSVTTANVSGVTSLAINLQSITDLTGLEEFISLSYLNAYGNGINSVDFSQNILLDTVIFFSNNLVTIDLSQNDSISYLDLKSNNLNA